MEGFAYSCCCGNTTANATTGRTAEYIMEECAKDQCSSLTVGPSAMGLLAPLPKATQDPSRPETLPNDYYTYRDKGNAK